MKDENRISTTTLTVANKNALNDSKHSLAHNMSDDNGFSLIEIIVSVAIIGIIAAIALVLTGDAQDNAKQAAVDRASRDAHVMAQANMEQGDPTGGDLTPVETDNVMLSLADTFVDGQVETLCVRADWIGNNDIYSISGGCEESDTTIPIHDRDPEDPLYTRFTYQCPTTKEGYLGVVNIAEETRVQIWEEDDRDNTIREVMYDEPEEAFDLRYEARQEILRTRAFEAAGGDISVANAYLDHVIEQAAEDELGPDEVPEYSIEETIDNASELLEMEQGVRYVIRFDGPIETFAAPGHQKVTNDEDSLADCLVSIDHFGERIGLKNLVYLGGENLEAVPENIPSTIISLRAAIENAENFNDPSIRTWETGNVRIMRSMFINAYDFNQDISSWDMSNVSTAEMMFQNAESFNRDINDWDTSSMTTTWSMFKGATRFNQDLNNWDVSNVTDIRSMFHNAETFDGDITAWNPSSATNMDSMFRGAKSFNGDISSWDVGSAEQMTQMFDGAISFNQNLSCWNALNVEAYNNFDRASLLAEESLPAFGENLPASCE